MIFDLSDCQEKLGYKFKDQVLLRKCFTHSSYSYEHGGDNNELLEFFGDSVIQFVVTEFLFKNCKGDEGDLTEKRKNLVSRKPLQKAIERLGLTEYVLLGKGQSKFASQDEKLYSSVYEAIVAGIYLDGGMKSAKAFLNRTLIAYFRTEQKAVKKEKLKDDKSNLQEYVQKKKLGSLRYETLSKTGPDHDPSFKVSVSLNGTVIGVGVGKSKKVAETQSAKFALEKLLEDGKV